MLEGLSPSNHCFSFSSKCLRLGLAIRIEVRSLTDAHCTIAEALTEAFVVEGCSVEHAAVVPDGYRSLSVMILLSF
jgi:hypothetical protein